MTRLRSSNRSNAVMTRLAPCFGGSIRPSASAHLRAGMLVVKGAAEDRHTRARYSFKGTAPPPRRLTIWLNGALSRLSSVRSWTKDFRIGKSSARRAPAPMASAERLASSKVSFCAVFADTRTVLGLTAICSPLYFAYISLSHSSITRHSNHHIRLTVYSGSDFVVPI